MRTLLQMIDAIYGDFSKCTNVPDAAASPGKEKKLLVPVTSFLRESYDSDKGKIAGQQTEQGQKVLLQTALGICYFVMSLLVSIALSSIFLWLGASIAGEKGSTFRTALVCSSFDRVTIGLLLIGVTFLLSVVSTDGSLQVGAMRFVVPVALIIAFFFISTTICKYVYKIGWGKAFLIQFCARVAVLLVAVVILGFASAAYMVA
ncbi:MAG TPA: hypothetical protein VM141_10820 [Planctomycetota bacterium]|nr:hypothetical protein [Planctomycetota bacterium]